MIGTLIYAIDRASLPSLFFDSFQMIQNGRGVNSPITLENDEPKLLLDHGRNSHCEGYNPITSRLSDREQFFSQGTHRNRSRVVRLDDPSTPLIT